MMSTRCRLCFQIIPLALLLPFGCQQANNPVPLDIAMKLQKAGKTDQAIALLVLEDIEKNCQASSLRTLKMSEKQFISLNRWSRSNAHEESVLMLPLIKKAASLQIENMQAAQAAGLSAESKEIQKQLQRLIRFLQDKNRLLIYQQLGIIIEKKLNQAPANKETGKTDSTDAD
ncbi:hypothetical protein [Gimesia aquarii]|uniref:Uncharacterized protein n=1 Tax=Gimesia aquarii TaxID=2527964 RepID=A0A517W211_9PLAN|nr:hypothetical protein [Gimesia aquarii]QDT99288.1 hypothetical protein V144x_47990 [Gimesia aquarii]